MSNDSWKIPNSKHMFLSIPAATRRWESSKRLEIKLQDFSKTIQLHSHHQSQKWRMAHWTHLVVLHRAKNLKSSKLWCYLHPDLVLHMPFQGHAPPCLSAGWWHQLWDVFGSISPFLESVTAGGGVLSDLTWITWRRARALSFPGNVATGRMNHQVEPV